MFLRTEVAGLGSPVFRREKAKAEVEGLTQKEFNDRMNNPDLYQLEDPSSNRSHRFEMKD